MANNGFSYEDLAGTQPSGSAPTAPTPAVPQGDDAMLAAGYRPVQDPNSGHLVAWLPPVAPTDAAVANAPTPAPAAPPASAQEPAATASTAASPASPAPGSFSYEDVAQGAPAGPDQRPTSEALGFAEGVVKPSDNLASFESHAPGAGFIQSLSTGVLHALGMKSPAELAAERNAGFANAERTQRPGELGKVGGEIVGTLPLSLVPGGGGATVATKLPMMAGFAARTLPVLAQGAATGALLTDHPDDAGQVARDAVTGAAGGYLGGKVVGAVGKAASPVLKAPVQRLIDAGVTLTPGQIMGGGAKRIEDSLTSWPILGDAIKSAQRRSMESFNTAAANDSLAHIGESVPSSVKPGRDTIAHVERKLGDAYDAIKPQLSADIDLPFVQGVGQLRQTIAPEALDAMPTFDRILKQEVLGRANPQTLALDGQAAKDAQTAIGQEIATYSPNPSPQTQALVRGLRGLQDELSASLQRNSAPDAAARLADINAGYAKYARLRDASAASSERDNGLFTPYQLGQAVKKGDKTVGKGARAKGQALMQDLSSAGEQVLPSTVPDSGTPLRLIISELPMLVGFGAESQHFFPQLAGTLGVGGLAGLPYSRTGQALTQRALTTRPWTPAQTQALVDAVRPFMVDAGGVGGENAGAKLPQLPAR